MCYFDTPLVYLAPEMYMSGNDLEVWTQLWFAVSYKYYYICVRLQNKSLLCYHVSDKYTDY